MINDLGIEIHGYEFINQPRKREVKSRFIKYNKKPKYLHKLTKDSLIISKDKKICGVAIINRDAIPDDISIQPAENGGAVNPFRLKELILDEKLTYNEYMLEIIYLLTRVLFQKSFRTKSGRILYGSSAFIVYDIKYDIVLFLIIKIITSSSLFVFVFAIYIIVKFFICCHHHILVFRRQLVKIFIF